MAYFTTDMRLTAWKSRPIVYSATLANGTEVILRFLNDDTDELNILKFLKKGAGVANRIIDLLCAINVSVGTAIARDVTECLLKL